MYELGHSPWVIGSTLLPLFFDVLVPRVNLPHAGLHVGDVLDDKPGDLRYVVLSDCEIPY